MHIQPPTGISPGTGAQGVVFPETSGGTSPGAGEGLRADWQVRMNVSHSDGFVGGAGRLLVHNETAEDRTEVAFLLPAALTAEHGSLRLLAAVVCSAKPGIAATPGQTLVMQLTGARAALTVPLLKMNDWLYIDLTWDGQFQPGGGAWPGGAVPLGKFHPQVAVDVTLEGSRKALAPVPARYDVTLGADPGASVRLEGEGSVVSRISDDGRTSEHEFRSYGSAQIMAHLLSPGSVAGAEPAAPVVSSASFDAPAPSRNRFTRS